MGFAVNVGSNTTLRKVLLFTMSLLRRRCCEEVVTVLNA